MHFVLETAGHVHHQRVCGARIARADEPRRDELGIGVERNPRPHVAVAELALLLNGDVRGLRIAKLPDLIALNTTATQPAKMLVLIVRARGSKFRQ